ncbi:DUF998 domain-containing protein [Thermodesulfobacteriota bacterium]
MSQIDLFLIVLLVASIMDLLVPTFLAKQYPGYSHFSDTISTLGTSVSPVKKYQCLNLVIVGLLFIVFSAGQALLFRRIAWCHVLYILGIGVFGLGTIMAGIFPEDPQGAGETVSGKIHGISSGMGFIFLILNPLWALWVDEFNNIKLINGIIFPSAVITFVLFIVSEMKSSGILKYTGLFQRINIIILYSHLVVNYIYIRIGI